MEILACKLAVLSYNWARWRVRSRSWNNHAYLWKLPWIFPGAPLNSNGAPGNTQSSLALNRVDIVITNDNGWCSRRRYTKTLLRDILNINKPFQCCEISRDCLTCFKCHHWWQMHILHIPWQHYPCCMCMKNSLWSCPLGFGNLLWSFKIRHIYPAANHKKTFWITLV